MTDSDTQEVTASLRLGLEMSPAFPHAAAAPGKERSSPRICSLLPLQPQEARDKRSLCMVSTLLPCWVCLKTKLRE